MKLLVRPRVTEEEFHKKITPELLEQMGLLEESLGKISLADMLEGKTKQYVDSNMVAKHNLTMEEFHQYLQNVIDSKAGLRVKILAVEAYIKKIKE
jgi:hypothetical protein